MSRLGALILTGGASSRMGEDKAALSWLGFRAVDRVAELAKEAGADLLITSGRWSYGLPFVADARDLGGPVGGIMAGAAALGAEGADRLLVLAVDAPTLQRQDLEPLLSLEKGGAYAGFPLPLTVQTASLPTDAAADWPLSRLLDRSGVARLPCPPGAASRIRGANTPAEREALLQDLREYERSGVRGATR